MAWAGDQPKGKSKDKGSGWLSMGLAAWDDDDWLHGSEQWKAADHWKTSEAWGHGRGGRGLPAEQWRQETRAMWQADQPNVPFKLWLRAQMEQMMAQKQQQQQHQQMFADSGTMALGSGMGAMSSNPGPVSMVGSMPTNQGNLPIHHQNMGSMGNVGLVGVGGMATQWPQGDVPAFKRPQPLPEMWLDQQEEPPKKKDKMGMNQDDKNVEEDAKKQSEKLEEALQNMVKHEVEKVVMEEEAKAKKKEEEESGSKAVVKNTWDNPFRRCRQCGMWTYLRKFCITPNCTANPSAVAIGNMEQTMNQMQQALEKLTKQIKKTETNDGGDEEGLDDSWADGVQPKKKDKSKSSAGHADE